MTVVRTVGEVFTIDGTIWQVYSINPDGTICSRFVGTTPKATRPEKDFTQTCAHRQRGTHHRITHCDSYVVKGTRYCAKHQHVPRYYTSE